MKRISYMNEHQNRDLLKIMSLKKEAFKADDKNKIRLQYYRFTLNSSGVHFSCLLKTVEKY